MRPAAFVFCFGVLGLAVACGTKDVGQAVGDAGSDTALLHDANGAVSEVIRNASDCPAARAAIAPAYEKLDAIEKQLRTEAGRTTVAGLRKQVDHVSELCPQ